MASLTGLTKILCLTLNLTFELLDLGSNKAKVPHQLILHSAGEGVKYDGGIKGDV